MCVYINVSVCACLIECANDARYRLATQLSGKKNTHTHTYINTNAYIHIYGVYVCVCVCVCVRVCIILAT